MIERLSEPVTIIDQPEALFQKLRREDGKATPKGALLFAGAVAVVSLSGILAHDGILPSPHLHIGGGDGGSSGHGGDVACGEQFSLNDGDQQTLLTEREQQSGHGYRRIVGAHVDSDGKTILIDVHKPANRTHATFTDETVEFGAKSDPPLGQPHTVHFDDGQSMSITATHNKSGFHASAVLSCAAPGTEGN